MVEYNLEWLKEKGFFKKQIPLAIENRKVLVDDENLLAYVELSGDGEIETIRRELSSSKVACAWFYFSSEKGLKVFRRFGDIKWFYYSPRMRSDFLKSRTDKLDRFSPKDVTALFDIRDIVNKFYDQLWETRVKMARSITKPKEDVDRLLIVQHLIDRLIFLYFICQLKLVKIKNEKIEWTLDRKNTRDFFKWICETLSDEDLLVFLNRIFFDALGRVEQDTCSSLEFSLNEEKFSVIAPSLNGGLFIEQEIGGVSERAVKIKGTKNLILDILNKYNWIIGEETPEGEDVIGDLTPEIIGHIYEKFIVSLEQIGIKKINLNDIKTIKGELKAGRKSIGAYYTPDDITNYISINTLYPYIKDRLKENFGDEGISTWKKVIEEGEKGKIDDSDLKILKHLYFGILKEIKICDNACGSGSFLISAGEVLLHLRNVIIELLRKNLAGDREVQILLNESQKASGHNYYAVRNIITNNLYGTDIMDGAIEIAKLRFWLWLISQVAKENEGAKIEPLPNLDFNLMVGNSLIGFVTPEEIGTGKGTFLEPLGRKGQQKLAKAKGKQFAFVKGESITDIMKDIGLSKKRFKLECDLETRKLLKKEIEARSKPLREKLDKRFLEKLWENNVAALSEQLLELKPFHWGFEFYEVFDLEKSEEERGFDIIIGNPPYGNILEDLEKETIFTYETKSASEIAANFIEASLNIVRKKGYTGFIVANSIAINASTATARNLIRKSMSVSRMALFGTRPAKIFSDAEIRVMIFLGQKDQPRRLGTILTTDAIKFTRDQRASLLDNLSFESTEGLSLGSTRIGDEIEDTSLPKVGNSTIRNILLKLKEDSSIVVKDRINKPGYKEKMEFRKTGGYWLNALEKIPYKYESTKIETLKFETPVERDFSILVINSSLFYLYWSTYGNLRDFPLSLLEKFPFPSLKELNRKRKIIDDLKITLSKCLVKCFEPERGRVGEFRTALCKDQIDSVDDFLGEVYRLSKEELEFVKRYDNHIRKISAHELE